ncbi:penicillin-binding protein [Wolbachia endosymbiont of Atemnus politus]|uniref:penicillin-binding transpeptidase domain-containing protein n=1 Tax=Wolbachia endosymbiont of Atemnus politus TaxID=2682840 RepID=UPI001572ACE6|nr:penicillin-binding transpeptidase domain-containing protein [Wolbachia endosymbiont of Atemnus politus]NSM56766.1 penicillin-binding protein [Wolbachia endosymbiont of Atemnus politus]NSX83092.1 penicillin-binding protein [Wolbachia endosymbiont of Atemnus politus]
MRTKNKVFNRRAFILGGIQLTISAIFSYRLYNLQIRNRQKYEALSSSNRTRIATIMPKRGRILDRNGVGLAINKISYVVLFDGQKTSGKEVDLQTLSEIESEAVELSETKVTALYKRYYPFGSMCSHVLGYTKKQQGINEVGISGIEYTYDHILKGEPGKSEQEINSRKRIVRELSNIPQQNGQDVHLTIDIDLQEKIVEIFKDHKGSAVVIDVNNGEILALYNSPSYDNNLFTNRLSNETWESLNVPSLPLVNRALSYQIPPGSIFKIIVALAGLKDGIITPEEKFLCRGYMKIGERKFRCLKSKVHGYVSLNEAMALSCNTYFYNIGKKISVDSLVEMARKFGIGSGPLIGTFKEEAPGLLPDRDWRARKLYSEWYLGDTINLVIGQGYILTTPLQLAVLAARIATGKEVIPYIEISNIAQDFSDIDVDHEHLNIVRKTMFDVVNSNYRKGLSGVQIAGKTGTPEINSKGESHKLFIAYGPYHNPRYAISMFIEHGKVPRQDVTITNEILRYMLEK